MKKTYTDEQIVGILRGFEASDLTIKEYCRKKAVGEQKFDKRRKRFERWKSKNGGNSSRCRRKTSGSNACLNAIRRLT